MVKTTFLDYSAGVACLNKECCDARDQCDATTTDCGPTGAFLLHDTAGSAFFCCAGSECTRDECCQHADQCAASDCKAKGKILKSVLPSTFVVWLVSRTPPAQKLSAATTLGSCSTTVGEAASAPQGLMLLIQVGWLWFLRQLTVRRPRAR